MASTRRSSGANNTTMVNLDNTNTTPDLVLGFLQGSTGDVALTTGGLILGTDNSNQTFGGTISGIGGMLKVGSGTRPSAPRTPTPARRPSPPHFAAGQCQRLAKHDHLARSEQQPAVRTGIGTFNIAGLAGTGNVALNDTNGNPVNLVAGSNGSSTAYSGVLSGNGSLDKVGSGTLTLGGMNTYSGPTTVNNGTLVAGVQNTFVYASGTVTVNAGARSRPPTASPATLAAPWSSTAAIWPAAPRTPPTAVGPSIRMSTSRPTPPSAPTAWV